MEKYDVGHHATLPVLDGLTRVESVESVEHLLEATYVDTADLSLVRAGIALRRCTGGADDGWHLLLPGSRAGHEIRLALGRTTSTTAPKRLRDVVAVHTRGKGLTPVATAHTHRTEHRLLDRDGHVLATVREDVVTAESAGPLATWREWEVELVDGKPSLLAAVGRLLDEAGAFPSPASSPLERALSWRLPEIAERPAPSHRKKDPAALLVRARLVEQVDELLQRDPLVRADAPGGVHKMRVATRRLRSNLATFRPVLDRG